MTGQKPKPPALAAFMPACRLRDALIEVRTAPWAVSSHSAPPGGDDLAPLWARIGETGADAG